MTVVAIAAGLGAEHYDVSGISCTQGLAICHDCGRACTTQTSFSFSSNLWSPLRRASVRVRCTPAADSATRSDSGRVFIHGRQVGAIVRSGVGVGVRVPIEVVSQRLGHPSIGVTVERYLHVYRSRDAEAADAFGRLVG
jgi:hypothetical protein